METFDTDSMNNLLANVPVSTWVSLLSAIVFLALAKAGAPTWKKIWQKNLETFKNPERLAVDYHSVARIPKRFFTQNISELETHGFSFLVGYTNLALSKQRTVNYNYITVSRDRTVLGAITYKCRPRYLYSIPCELPFPTLTGSRSKGVVFESAFDDETRLITSNFVSPHPLPDAYRLQYCPWLSNTADILDAHLLALDELSAKKGKDAVCFRSASDYFSDADRQRRQLSSFNEQRIEQQLPT